MTAYQLQQKITADEWRLQWRGYGHWLGGLLLIVLVLIDIIDRYDALESARIWSDRAVLTGAVYVLFVTPFVLDRLRRTQSEAIELSKPFWERTYLLGKFVGALLPVLLLLLISGLLSFGIILFTASNAEFLPLLQTHLHGYLLIVLPPIIFLGALGYCLSLFLRPIVIVPLLLFYYVQTTITQQVADAQFSWLSPLVRPEYFPDRIIPADLWQMVVLHQITYLTVAGVLMLVTMVAFDRRRWLDEGRSRLNWRSIWHNLPVLPISPGLRRFWGAPVVAALVMSILLPTIGLDTYTTDAWIQQLSAMFVLEFYFALVGLLLITGVVARDKGMHTLDLILTKPVNRWSLLAQRLLPAVGTHVFVATVLILAIHFTFIELPLVKAFMVAIATGLYLGMVGMTVANVTRSALAGYGVGIVYWALEAGFGGQYTAPFFLLTASHQPQSTDFWRHTESLWLSNKIGLLLLAGWLFILNGWLLDHGVRRRRALIVTIVTIPLIFAIGWQVIPLVWR